MNRQELEQFLLTFNQDQILKLALNLMSTKELEFIVKLLKTDKA